MNDKRKWDAGTAWLCVSEKENQMIIDTSSWKYRDRLRKRKGHYSFLRAAMRTLKQPAHDVQKCSTFPSTGLTEIYLFSELRWAALISTHSR